MSTPVVGDSSGIQPGISGANSGGGDGVLGAAAGGNGVAGLSTSGTGVRGASTSGVGVWSQSQSGYGAYASSETNDGMHCESASSKSSAVAGINSAGGHGVYGRSSANAGFFEGNVTVSGDIVAKNITVQDDIKAAGATFAKKITVKDISATGTMTVAAEATFAAGVTAKDISATGNLKVKGDIFLTGADCAERFDLKTLEVAAPGSVMVIDDCGALRLSDGAYDRKVAGVVSGAGAFKPGIILDQRADDEPRATIALVGKVYCLSDADAGAIAVGDLLTTSDTPGHAMRVSDPTRAFGSVIGKALKGMASGRGLLPILVALQ